MLRAIKKQWYEQIKEELKTKRSRKIWAVRWELGNMKLSICVFVHHQCPLLHVSIHRNPLHFPLSLLSCSTTGCPVGVDAELRNPDWLQVTQENTQCTNDSSRWLVHHSEVMWSGGGLKESLISVHTVTLKQHNWLNKPELVQLVRLAVQIINS